MRIAVAMALAWALYMIVALGRMRAAGGRPRLWEGISLGGISAALGGVAVAEVRGAEGAAVLWGEIVLAAGVLGMILGRSWLSYRAFRFAFSFAIDFAGCLAVTAALVGVLYAFVLRLHPLAPFGALVVGVLSFFLPVNALAEVFHAGVDAGRGQGRGP